MLVLGEGLAPPLMGGALVGLAAAVLLVVAGRVMAIPAMVASLLGGAEGIAAWGIAFIAGLLMAAPLLGLLPFALLAPGAGPGAGPGLGSGAGSGAGLAWTGLIAGGLLIGFGTRLARAGPHGDGLVALSRGSPRAVIAVLAMAVGGLLAVLGVGLVPLADPVPGGAS